MAAADQALAAAFQTQQPKPEEPEIKVEIVDDRPEVDRREPAAPEELATVSPSAEELDQYSAKVQRRIKKLDWGYQEERRQKEEALRQRDAAAAYASALHQQNELLKKATVANHQAATVSAVDSMESRLKAAQQRLKTAHEAGDTDQLVQAQSDIAEIVGQKVLIQRTPPLTEAQIPYIPPPQFPAAQEPEPPPPDPRLQEWHRTNTWFGQDADMTAFSLSVDQRLQAAGYEPDTEQYFQALDREMANRFPDRLQRQPAAGRRTPSSVVAPVTRMNDRVRPNGVVTLSASEAAMARKLGVTPEDYAKEVLRMQASGEY